MRSLLFGILVLVWSSMVLGQYEDYKSYETFSDLDKWERDYGLVFSPTLFYTQITESNEVSVGSVNDRSRRLLFYDVQFGYIFRNGFYFGVLYAGESQVINDDAPRSTRESFGASFGWIRRGWSFKATLFPYSKQSLENVGVSDYTEGLGYQVDVGYYFRLGRFVSVGPQLVFKSLSYGKAEDAATSVNVDASSQHDVFTPMVSFLFNLYRG